MRHAPFREPKGRQVHRRNPGLWGSRSHMLAESLQEEGQTRALFPKQGAPSGQSRRAYVSDAQGVNAAALPGKLGRLRPVSSRPRYDRFDQAHRSDWHSSPLPKTNMQHGINRDRLQSPEGCPRYLRYIEQNGIRSEQISQYQTPKTREDRRDGWLDREKGAAQTKREI